MSRPISFYQRRYDDRHTDDYRTAADDAAEQAAECMADFDRREARRAAGMTNDDEEVCDE